MQQIAERLTAKIQTLTPDQQDQVQRFVESLHETGKHAYLTQAAASLSAPSFSAIWDNPEDDAYDAI